MASSISGGVVQSGRRESPVEIQAVYERLRASVCGVIVGKDRVVNLCLIALLAGGHVLLTDVPGGGEPGTARLGEIYLHARFRDAVPAALVGEFDRLEPKVLAATERLKEAQTTRT
jgi:hypothetical protein